MDTKNTFGKIWDNTVKFLKFVGKFLWSSIRAIATIITFIIIFVLVAKLISLKVAWILLLFLLLWFVYVNRKKVATVIAGLIVCLLALALYFYVIDYLFPDLNKTKNVSIENTSGSKIVVETVK